MINLYVVSINNRLLNIVIKRFAVCWNCRRSSEQHGGAACVSVTSFACMVERLELVARKLGMRFSHLEGSTVVLSGEMFHVEVLLDPVGGALDVWIKQGANAVVSVWAARSPPPFPPPPFTHPSLFTPTTHCHAHPPHNHSSYLPTH